MNKSDLQNRKAYIIGGGIAGLATATFLIKDGGMKGKDIFILDSGTEMGGSFDGQGSAKTGYVCRGYRLLERTVYLCTYDLMSKIPSPTNPRKTLRDDFLKFNERVKINAKARLMSRGKILEAHKMGLNWPDRFSLFKLLLLPEKYFSTKKVRDYFSTAFFRSNFWFEWATNFAFEPRHSLVEMKRYLVRFIVNAPFLDDMTRTVTSPYCEHDFIVLPLLQMLKKSKINFRQNCQVTNIEFDQARQKTVTNLELNNKKDKIVINKDDLVFLTNGSMTISSSIGKMNHPPKLITKKKNSWDLWKKMSSKYKNLGNPSVFCDAIEKSKWEAFTITLNNPKFFQKVEKLTGNSGGTGGIITFKDSNWLISISLPHQPYFIKQPKTSFVCWGYSLAPDCRGNYIKKKMTDCNGREILKELCYHLGFEQEFEVISKNAICLPIMLPYITSQFLPHKKSDRPIVVPKGFKNFACIGQYVEIPNEIVFTVEGSVRSAKIAVKRLLNLPNKIPPLPQRQYNPTVLLRAIMTALR